MKKAADTDAQRRLQYSSGMTDQRAKRRRDSPQSLREDCVHEALSIIETSGLEALSLRDVARRLGVSHQAPYKHFPSRDHILAEIVARAYQTFADYLDNRPRTGSPRGDLREMGKAYVAYALEHPLQYRLMFNTPLPNPQEHTDMMRQARHAFSLLCDNLTLVHSDRGSGTDTRIVTFDALFIWSTLHGLSSILGSNVIDTLSLSQDVLEELATETLLRIGRSLDFEHGAD